MTYLPKSRAAVRSVGAAMFALWASSATAQESGSPIPWKQGVSFSRTAVDDDVRSVLRAILAADGLSAIFRPGVNATVSFNFRDMSLEAAFTQVLQSNGLTASFNAGAKTVTIGPATAASDARRFITLQNVDWPSLRQMLVSFGIGTDGTTFDATTSVLGVTGDAGHIAQIEDLVKTLEQHYGDKREQALSETLRSTSAQRSDYERRSYADAINVQTRVFRLRFADVGPTTRNFHGRTVTIPGILETLQAMLGNAPGNAPYAVQRAAPSPFTPAIASRTGGQAPPQAQAPGAPEPSRGGIGQPNISIDQRTNSVIVRGSPSAIAAVGDVLQQIDQPVKMVEIEVIIATAELGVLNQLGISYRGDRGNSLAFDTGTTGGQFNGITGLNPLTLLPATAAGATAASFVLSGSGVSVQAQLQALASKNKARVLSAPHLVTLDNITARITRSEDIYVPVDTGGLNGQGLSQIQTGLTLEITPSIVPVQPGSADQLVRLTLDATNSAPGSGTGDHINVNSQEVQTDVLVPNGGTFVIGGLFDDSRLQSRSGIPVLKDVPLLGHLFRTDSDQQSLGQTIFFITPHIIDQTELVSRDVALGPTAAYMGRQRGRLDGVTREMSGAPRMTSASLEEDQ